MIFADSLVQEKYDSNLSKDLQSKPVKTFGCSKIPMHDPYKTYDKLNSRSHNLYIVVQILSEEKPESIAKIFKKLAKNYYP